MAIRFYLLLLFLLSCNNSEQTPLQNIDRPKSYVLEKDWLKLPGNYKLGNPTGIGIDTNQNIFIFHRGGRKWPLIGSMPDTYISDKTILEIDRNTGKVIHSWGNNLFIMPHGLTVDKNDNVWVTDVGLHQVYEFSHEGKLLMKLGEAKVSGDDKSHFNKPTDVAVARDGSFYVSDGYGNSRVIKFSPAGKYLFEWGKKGKKEGDFNLPHAITLDDRENVYIADRENNRVEVFDSTGKFIKQWTDKDFGRIGSVAYNEKQKNFVAVDDATSFFKMKHNGSDIILFDTAGNFIEKFGKNDFKMQNIKCWYHDVVVDDEGNIYVGDILGNSVQKFREVSKE